MILARSLQLLSWSLAGFLFVWPVSDPRFRDPDGFLGGSFCLPVSVGVALVILGCTVAGRFKRFAFWLALGLVGQAVALQLIDAGTPIRYQHYKLFGRLLTEAHPALLVYLAMQTILVVAAFIVCRPNIVAWISRNFKLWQLLAMGLAFSLGAAAVSRDIRVLVAEFPFAVMVQTINLANIVLMVLALPEEALPAIRRGLERLFGHSGDGKGSGKLDRFAVLAALWVVILAAVLSYYSYERHPHTSMRYIAKPSRTAAAIVNVPSAKYVAMSDVADLIGYADAARRNNN